VSQFLWLTKDQHTENIVDFAVSQGAKLWVIDEVVAAFDTQEDDFSKANSGSFGEAVRLCSFALRPLG
jgi:hypothetical protein